LTKPFRSHDEVALTVAKAGERRRLVGRAEQLARRLEQMQLGELIGHSPAMRKVYRLALGVAPTESTVLILGESGTGKELTARAIHQHSLRSGKEFVAVNCAAIPADLVESELFGHVRGAFSGATQTRRGLFEAADRGTIFLDEVGDLPLAAQVKLLRVLQQGEIKPVGSDESRRVDVRVIAATNVDLRESVERGTFRQDVYYRLNVIPIKLPPLRDRREDVPLLANHFLQKHARRAGRSVTKISPEAMEFLCRLQWPGNVRELENTIEHAVVFCQTEVMTVRNLPQAGSGQYSAVRVEHDEGGWTDELFDLPFTEAKRRALEEFEATYLSKVLERAGGNVSEAARQAGLDRSNFRRTAKRARVFDKK
jgi:DNA-binding NtrC family response regulator